jgi:murein DD-endopeptidase MepM/ murein hydrolase activator NlpD
MLLAASCLLAADLTFPPATTATNWSHRIAAVRGSQLYYESLMRGADLQLRRLRHAERRGQRSLTKARRHLGEAREMRAEALAERRATLARLQAARARLVAQVRLPATPDDLGSLAMLPALAPSDNRASERTDDEARRDGPDTPSLPGSALALDGLLAAGPALAGLGPLPAAPDAIAPATMTTPAGTLPGVSVAAQLERASDAVLQLESDARYRERTADRARRKLHRIARSVKAKARAVRSIRAAMHGASARRAGAEAGLANAILGMSDLAQRRVAKKTDVRPGYGSPLAWPTVGRMVQGYGFSHDGIDIAGYLGTPIRAAAVGVVSYIGWNPWDHKERAFMVVVAHPGGLETLYGHIMPRRDVRVGQLVRRGELIGFMGSTGKATGVHLHLEMRRGRTTLDPLAFL